MTTSNGHVLIVEDDAPTREMYRLALRLAGFEVRPVADGLTALQQIEEEVPALIVLDLDVPHVNGVAILDELGAHTKTADVPVIVVTGTDWQPRRPPAAVLSKPVSPEELAAVVADVLRRRR